jgi:hypothetical protein
MALIASDKSKLFPNDGTEYLQSLLDKEDEVIVPAGTEWSVNALQSLRMRSGNILQLDGMLRAMPNDKDHSAVILIDHVQRVKVHGAGKIFGERYSHKGTMGPEHSHGMGVRATHSSEIEISGITAQQCLGDGFYLQDVNDTKVHGVTGHDNRRNSLSLTQGERIKIIGNTFGATNGPSPLPQSGIDIEPDLAEQQLIDITVSGNRFIKNKGAGVYIAFEPSAHRRNVHVINNYMDQHYKDGSGPFIGGKNTPLCNFLYAVFRWTPGYDWWAFPQSFEC